MASAVSRTWRAFFGATTITLAPLRMTQVMHFSLLVLFLLCSRPISSHPAPSSSTCHGPVLNVRYQYRYETSLTLNNNDNFEPAGFRAESHFSVENLWQDTHSYLTLIQLDHLQLKPRPDARSYQFASGPALTEWPPVLANIEGATGHIRSLYVEKPAEASTNHHLIEPTHLNLIVSILNSLRNHFPKEDQVSYTVNRDGRNLVRHSEHTETSSIYSLLAPQIVDNWEIRSQLASDHDVCESVSGWQNVTIESKLYPNAHSKLFVNFYLQLNGESKTSTNLEKAKNLNEALQLYGSRRGKRWVSASLHFVGEKKPCQPHHCRTFSDLVSDYRTQLAEDHSLATSSMAIAYLKLLNHIRTNSAHITRKDVLKLLQKYHKSRGNDGNVMITLLDVIAGSRNSEAMMAALDFLDLTKCADDKASDCERFLVSVAISAMTTANMGHSYVAEHSLSSEQLVDLLLPLIKSPSWADERVKHSFALSMGTLVHSYQVMSRNLEVNHSSLYADTLVAGHSSPALFVDLSDETEPKGHKQGPHHRLAVVAEKIIKQLIHELDTCKDSDCRIVYLHALGNTRIISKFGVFHVFKKYAISSGKRESVAAMKAMRDCLEFELDSSKRHIDDRLITRLKQALIRIVYDSNLETTTRLIAAELLAKYVDQHGEITLELVQHLETFPSELATMIWKRAVMDVRSRLTSPDNRTKLSDWHLHSKILSGSSASFRYVMGGTGHANASYGVFLELLKGKLPKETSFAVDLSSDPHQITQDIINVGLFARGLQSFAGNSEDEAGDESANEVADEEDSTLAGMTLRVLGNQLRPFLFFRSTSELMGHLWSGAASEPTPVFRSNLLMADYLDVKPLINGFLVEQSLKGIFSLDLNGEVQVSLWNRNSHSNVQTMGAVLFQGSQEIYLSNRQTSARKFFSFGAESKLNFITDFDFYSSPYRICIQITQPEFVFRHNTRKYESVHSDQLHRRIHRRSYKIPAKSYVLNRDNSEMCALMNANSDW